MRFAGVEIRLQWQTEFQFPSVEQTLDSSTSLSTPTLYDRLYTRLVGY